MHAADGEILTIANLRRLLAERCELAGSRSEWARRHRIPLSVVSETISGKRDPSPAVINAMGFLRVERFIPIKRGSNG